MAWYSNYIHHNSVKSKIMPLMWPIFHHPADCAGSSPNPEIQGYFVFTKSSVFNLSRLTDSFNTTMTTDLLFPLIITLSRLWECTRLFKSPWLTNLAHRYYNCFLKIGFINHCLKISVGDCITPDHTSALSFVFSKWNTSMHLKSN